MLIFMIFVSYESKEISISSAPVEDALTSLFFSANRTIALRETTNNTKYLKKNENYNEILRSPQLQPPDRVDGANLTLASSVVAPT
jgi:hypothetical protein